MLATSTPRSILLLLGALGLATAPLPAQMVEGSRIRVTVEPNGKRLVGVLMRQSRDSIAFRHQGAVLQMPLQEVRQLEHSLGRGSEGRKGALIGLIATSAVASGIIVYGTLTAQSGTEAPTGLAFVALGVIAGAGAGVGFVIGSGFKWESWQIVSRSGSTNQGSRQSSISSQTLLFGLRFQL